MRLEGHARMGYYPTPQSVIKRMKKHLQFPMEPFAALDPSAGTGKALNDLTAGSHAIQYGVELDHARADEAKKILDHTIQADFFRTKISKRSASLLLLNPPYADGDDGRLELQFLKAAHPLIRLGGVLIFIIPQRRLSRRVARVLNAQFSDVSVFRFPNPEYGTFQQVVVIGIRRERAVGADIPTELLAVPEADLPILPNRQDHVYEILPSPPIKVFRSTEIDLSELEAELAASPLGKEIDNSQPRRARPPVPLHRGHLLLLLASGELSGALGRGKDRHIVRGHVAKTVTTSREVDDDGNELICETEKFQIQIRTLWRSGELKVLT